MDAGCRRKNPLSRRGTNQDGRMPHALDPAFISVDERDTADLILFGQRLSQHIRYYDANNSYDSANPGDYDWLPFFGSDISAVLAGLMKLPVDSVLSCRYGLQDYLEDDAATSEADLSNHFKLLFHLPMFLLRDLGDFYGRISRGHRVRKLLSKALSRDGEEPLKSLIGYYKGALALGSPIFDDSQLQLGDYNTTFDDSDSRVQLPAQVTERIEKSSPLSALPINEDYVAEIAPTGWVDFYNSIDAKSTPYEDGSSLYEQIYDALNYNLLTNAVDRLLNMTELVTRDMDVYFDESLSNSEEHTPHFALWLTFLKLFSHNQDHINELTERHLDYYYKDILRLSPRDAEPDQVHLLFELNKTVENHLLSAGTEFKAGKDDLSRDVTYQLDSDLVVNRASVETLKSFFISGKTVDGVNVVTPHACSVTNSSDGEGDDLPEDDPQWCPFGPEDAPSARIGFAIADKQLFMREGERTIQVVAVGDAPSTGFFSSAFKASYTCEDGWWEASESAALTVLAIAKYLMLFNLALDGEDPPMIPYDPEIHGEGYPTGTPILRIEFDFSQETDTYSVMRDFRFDSISLRVAAAGLRQFTLQNETGAVDTSKPFLPFGPEPRAHSALTLGSSELFSKALEAVTLSVEWDEQIDGDNYFLKKDASDYKARLSYLKEGGWVRESSHDIAIFSGSSESVDIELNDLSDLSTTAPQLLEDVPYSKDSVSGFVRLDLNAGFGHNAYVDEKTKALIHLSGGADKTSPSTYNYDDEDDPQLPFEPYTPQISEMTVSYQTPWGTPEFFLHVYPFGQREQNHESERLFPDLPNEGELYIGVAGLEPPQRLSMLFQTVDGSANPLKLENTLSWRYLRDNEWVDLEEKDVDDKTDNLTGSGVIGLSIPEDAGTEHTVMPSGFCWLCMSVDKDIDALNNLFSIDPQAASATFLDQDNDPSFMETPLDAGTISKLKVGDAAVKKITQPYESFGGRGEESADEFYMRASERLRHKDRASTMWDYERLVLESFPKVYKVKCINHTKLCRDQDSNILADNEVSPGSVLVVAVPYVNEEGTSNPLRPYTDKSTLVAIDDFLRRRMSPFVELEVQNPKIEEVQVEFKVAFHEEIGDIAFYKDELNQAIIRFLTPWSYDDGADIDFGGRWYKSTIINFVEELSYVDYVKDFAMYHKQDIDQSDDVWQRIDEETVQATTSRSILVSHTAHIIEEIESDS